MCNSGMVVGFLGINKINPEFDDDNVIFTLT